ncbi:MAG: O-antigen ligase family protein, partial [Firmicutes bacterium]|nr:O-antigen ligase family protein [Bacillota bacterium]
MSNDFRNGIVIGKYFWFYGSMFFVAIITPVIYFINKYKIQITVIDWLVAALAISILLSSIVINDNMHTTKVVTFILLVTLYFFFRVLFSQCKISVQIILLALIIIALVEAVLGLMQLHDFAYSNHGLFKTTGTFSNPGPYAGYLAIIFPVVLYEFVKNNEIRVKNFLSLNFSLLSISSKFLTFLVFSFSFLTLIAIILVLPATLSRASWLALVAGSLIVLEVHYFEHIKKFINEHKKKLALVGIVTGFFLFAAFAGMYFMKKDSADGRTLMWKVSLQAAIQNPSGVGLGHFPAAYGKVQVDYFLSNKASEQEEYVAGNPEYAFNEYLQISIESGVISLILYVALIVLAMLKALRNNQYGIFGAFISLSVFALFSYPFSMLPHLILFVALLATASSNTNNNYSKESFHGFILKGGAVLLFMGLTVFCLINRYPVYKAYKDWNYNFSYGLSDERTESYERIYSSLKDNVTFLFEYAQHLAGHEKYEQSNIILQRAMQISCDPMLYNVMGRNHQALIQYDKAEQNFVTSTLLVPNRLYSHYLLTKLYNEMGNNEKATETANIV